MEKSSLRRGAAVLTAVLILAAAHAATTGPVTYAESRGWLPYAWAAGFRLPEDRVFASGDGYHRYLSW